LGKSLGVWVIGALRLVYKKRYVAAFSSRNQVKAFPFCARAEPGIPQNYRHEGPLWRV
jgi:hypothetical protein